MWVSVAESSLIHAHSSLGTPWWISIVGFTLGIRLISSPVRAYSIRNTAKVSKCMEVVEKQKLRSQIEAKKRNSSLQKVTHEKLSELYSTQNCHPNRSLLSLFYHIPVFLTVSAALRKMSGFNSSSAQAGFECGGTLWFTNLTLTDPYHALPLAVCASNFFLLYVNRHLLQRHAETKLTKIFYGSMYTLNIVSVYILTHLPASVGLYVLTSSVFAVVEAFAFRRYSLLYKLCTRNI